MSKRRSSTKSWIADDTRSKLTGGGERALENDESMKIVACTTRFATVMCVIIAIVKVMVYIKVKAAVVKTSALDSCGDLIANCITLYTSYKMSRVDIDKYPVGQSKMEPIGVLVFSTLMMAMMIANAISNVEDVMEDEEDVGAQAIGNFWKAMFGNPVEL